MVLVENKTYLMAFSGNEPALVLLECCENHRVEF